MKAYKRIVFLMFLISAFFQNSCSQAQRIGPFDAASAFGYLEKQCEFGPRNPGSEGHKKCLEYLAAELEKYTPDVTRQRFKPAAGLRSVQGGMTNIVAAFHSARSSLKPVLLCAHWDTRPVADHDPVEANRDKPILGANDGASGVAVLLEAARCMKEKPPERPVVIALFDAEDGGRDGEVDTWCLGSKHFASGLNGSEFAFAVLLDLIGDKDLAIPMEGYSVQIAQDVVNDIWGRAHRLGIKQFKQRTGTYVYDDHVPLIQAGIRAVDIIDFDYPYWHTLEDTPDKCSPESLKAVGDVVLDLVYNP